MLLKQTSSYRENRVVFDHLFDLPYFIKYRVHPKEFKMNFHSHQGVELYFFHKGDASFILGDQFYSLNEESMVLVGDMEPHKFVPKQPGKCFRTVVNFLPEILCREANNLCSELLHPFLNPDRFVSLKGKDTSRINDLLRKMHIEYTSRPAHFDLTFRSYLAALIAELHRIVFYSSTDHMKVQPNTPAQKIVENVMKHLSEKFTEDISLDELAKSYYISPSYLCHLFKKETGITMTKFLMRRRMQHAKQFLISTTLSISEVAAKVGFNNASYFSATFKKMEKMSPQQYRQEYCPKDNTQF